MAIAPNTNLREPQTSCDETLKEPRKLDCSNLFSKKRLAEYVESQRKKSKEVQEHEFDNDHDVLTSDLQELAKPENQSKAKAKPRCADDSRRKSMVFQVSLLQILFYLFVSQTQLVVANVSAHYRQCEPDIYGNEPPQTIFNTSNEQPSLTGVASECETINVVANQQKESLETSDAKVGKYTFLVHTVRN